VTSIRTNFLVSFKDRGGKKQRGCRWELRKSAEGLVYGGKKTTKKKKKVLNNKGFFEY